MSARWLPLGTKVTLPDGTGFVVDATDDRGPIPLVVADATDPVARHDQAHSRWVALSDRSAELSALLRPIQAELSKMEPLMESMYYAAQAAKGGDPVPSSQTLPG